MSFKGSSQNDTVPVVHLNRKVAVSLVKDLIACDFTRREAKILANTVDQQNFMLGYRKDEIEKLQKEIEKRDALIKVKNEMIDYGYQRADEIEKVLKSEIRKKKFNKYLFFAFGLGSGYLVGNAVTK